MKQKEKRINIASVTCRKILWSVTHAQFESQDGGGGEKEYLNGWKVLKTDEKNTNPQV